MAMNSQVISTTVVLEKQIVNTISWVLNVSPRRLKRYTHFVDDLHLDEIDMVLLIAAIESNLGLYLSREEVAKVETVQDLNYYFEQQLVMAA